MENAMKGELNNYNETGHDTSTYGWDSFQKTLGCCGIESYKDWVGTRFDNKTGNSNIIKPTILNTGDCLLTAWRLPSDCLATAWLEFLF